MNAVAQRAEKIDSELREAEEWAKAHEGEIPSSVYSSIVLLGTLRSELLETRHRAANLLALFRRELGIIPKSERGVSVSNPNDKNKEKLSDEERLAALKVRRAKLLKEIRRYEDRLGKGRKKRQNKRKASPSHEAKQGEAEFAPSGEALFTGNIADRVDELKPLKVDRVDNFENPRGLHGASDDRVRHEHSVTTKTIHLSVETVTDPRTGKSVTASTDEIGPPNCQSTWTGIANTIISVIGYAIPVNRLSTMLMQSNPYFTSSRLCSQLKLAAEIFAPIYIGLGEQLPDCDVLLGDDTKARVLEINRALKDGGEIEPAPEGSLVATISEKFGRVFPKKKGKGNKRSLNVSVAIGKTNPLDPRSYVFFFRSHLGTFGDLVTKMLETRSPRKQKLTLVTDLATTNLMSTDLYKSFEITHAGCQVGKDVTTLPPYRPGLAQFTHPVLHNAGLLNWRYRRV